jgi:hypothetical protein
MIVPAALDTNTRWPLLSTLPPLAALPTAPATARAHVNAVLTGWQMDAQVDVAELVASELVTNALGRRARPRAAPATRTAGWR